MNLSVSSSIYFSYSLILFCQETSFGSCIEYFPSLSYHRDIFQIFLKISSSQFKSLPKRHKGPLVWSHSKCWGLVRVCYICVLPSSNPNKCFFSISFSYIFQVLAFFPYQILLRIINWLSYWIFSINIRLWGFISKFSGDLQLLDQKFDQGSLILWR